MIPLGIFCFYVLLHLLISRPPRHLTPFRMIDGCAVRTERTRFSIDPPRPFPTGFSLRARASFQKSSWLTGDRSFDDAVALEGEERWLTARFDAGVRAEILSLRALGPLSIEGGILEMRAGEAALAPAIALALLLLETLDVPKATADSARIDPIAGVRRRCLEVLIRDHPRLAKQVAPDLLEDEDPEVRLVAAKHTGPKAVSALRKLATDQDVPDRVRAAALGRYVHYETFDEARSVLAALCLEQRAALMPAVAKAIAQIGGDFEPALIAMLRSKDETTKVEATIALRRIGTLASIEALHALAKRSDVSDELRTLARRSAAAIQSAAHGEGGRLSISDGDGGEVSLEEEG